MSVLRVSVSRIGLRVLSACSAIPCPNRVALRVLSTSSPAARPNSGGKGSKDGNGVGKFGEIGGAREEIFFRKQSAKLIEKMKSHKHSDIEFHEAQIKKHMDAIDKAKKDVKDLEDQHLSNTKKE